MATFQWAGFDAIMSRLGKLADPDPTPLLEEWGDIIREDNRRGVLAGQDRDGNPMRPVTYRPKGPGKPKRPTKVQKNNVGARGIFAGLGPHASGLNNNLSNAEYRRMGGPPLAPRGPNSRVITNLVTVHSTAPVNGEWFAAGYWDQVVSTRGIPFLDAHFKGLATGRDHRTKLPVRDLRGVRPWGRQQAVKSLQRWARTLLKG